MHVPAYRFDPALAGPSVTDARALAYGRAAARDMTAHGPGGGGDDQTTPMHLPVAPAGPITASGSSTTCPDGLALRGYLQISGGNARPLERGWSAGMLRATDFVAGLPASPLEVI